MSTSKIRSVLPRVIASVCLGVFAISAFNISPQPVEAVAQFTSTRVYYQPYATTAWKVWSGNTCPSDARYSTNSGCVYADSVSSHSTLRYTNLDGSGTTDININCASGVNPVWQAPWNGVGKIVVDEINGKIYWENSFEPGVGRSNLDGTGCELVANGGYYGKRTIALDETATYLYSIQNSTIRRITLSDGTVTNLTFTGHGITLANLGDMVVASGKLYVAVSNVGSAGHIMEVTLDTSSSTQTARLLITSQPTGMSGVDVDTVNNKIYWATGSAVKRANLDGTSIETVYTGSVSMVQVLPTENKILMGVPGSNMFVTDLSGGNVTSLDVKSLGYVAAVVSNVAPPTTTTIAPTTTVAASTTTVAATTTVATTAVTAGPATTIAGSTSSSGKTKAETSAAGAQIGSTTTVPVPSTTTTTQPPAPAVKGGDGVIEVDGVLEKAVVTRSGNRFTVSAGNITATLTGLSNSGEIVPLDGDGAVRLSTSEMFELDVKGFEASSGVDVWMYSSPMKLGTLKVSTTGIASERYSIPSQVGTGQHRIVLRGTEATGKNVSIAFGMFVGAASSTSTVAKVLIAVPIALAMLIAIVIPTAIRRRRKVVAN
jgi:hypothetical protein